jgi:hypothetical protein
MLIFRIFFDQFEDKLAALKSTLAALIVCSIVWSCAIPVSPEPKLPQSLFERYPFTIHFYLSSDLKKATVSPLYGYEIELGRASVQSVTKTLENMFKEVISVNELSNMPKYYNGVIEPGINHFNFDLDTEVMEVAYSFKIYDDRKQIIETINVNGKSRRDAYRDLIVTNFLKEMTEKAIIDAMAQFMVAFKTNPKIQTWLAANKIEGNGVRQ